MGALNYIQWARVGGGASQGQATGQLATLGEALLMENWLTTAPLWPHTNEQLAHPSLSATVEQWKSATVEQCNSGTGEECVPSRSGEYECACMTRMGAFAGV